MNGPLPRTTRSDTKLRFNMIRWNLVLIGCNIAWRAIVITGGFLLIARGIYTIANVDPSTVVMAL